ncbi:DUF4232 domain-containing protein [Streptomyces radicis]|uniref:DUF4232 domain-containing protein n=1 Tax=Streptomyces radicis TaxID=1750517 RepID=A0A3A9WXJ6_9ACTN|nr:DUF4232 domain-containing protein [Streptomyces radicis]RKN12546.1 DUF4232 domain-containing protein [Streptomyces radicis]RKN27688.1 DUF4232 domain-containing protein [Streptomyces radicis]
MASHPVRAAALAALTLFAVAACAESTDSRDGGSSADRPPAEQPRDAAPESTTDDTDTDDTDAAEDQDLAPSEAPREPDPEPAPEPEGAGGDADDAWCSPDALTAAVHPLDAGAGGRHAALVLTNSSDAGCRTQGWPGLQLAAGDGDSIPTTTVRDDSESPRPLTVEPGRSVWAQLHWTVVPGDENPANGPCGPEPASIEVIPPDEYGATTADWSLGAVCGEGRIETLPLAAGEGPG